MISQEGGKVSHETHNLEKAGSILAPANNSTAANYPAWVCWACGKAAQTRKVDGVSTYHIGDCGICGKEKAVTQPRDFGYPDFKTGTRNLKINSAIPGVEGFKGRRGGVKMVKAGTR